MIHISALQNLQEVIPRGKFKHYIRKSLNGITQNEMGALWVAKQTVPGGIQAEAGWLLGRDIAEGDFHSEQKFDSSGGYQPGLHMGTMGGGFEIPMLGCTPEQLNQNFWRWDPGPSDS